MFATFTCSKMRYLTALITCPSSAAPLPACLPYVVPAHRVANFKVASLFLAAIPLQLPYILFLIIYLTMAGAKVSFDDIIQAGECMRQ